MTNSVDAIPSLEMRLAIHRRTVAYLEEQRAQFGALTPVHIRHQLDETRQQIAHVKAELVALGAAAEDQPGDVESDRAHGGVGSTHPHALRAYQRTLLDRLTYLSLDGISEWRGSSLRLADVYVERTLVPLTPNAPQATLAALVADRHTRLLIEGELGGGKTTALRRLALAAAATAINDARYPPLFPRPLDPPLIPLLLDARELIQTQSFDMPTAPTQFGLWDAIEHVFRRDGLASALPVLEHALRIGDCLVLIDGLDDVVEHERGRALLISLGRFIARYPDSRYVVTCRRISALPGSALFGFAHYTLPALDDDAINALVAAYYPVVAPITALTFDDGDEQVRRLSSQIRYQERLRSVAINPLGALLCVLAHAEGHPLPEARGLVFARAVDLLLDGWEQIRSEHHVPALAHVLGVEALSRRDTRLTLLELLALAFQGRPDRSGDSPASLRYAEVEPWLRESLMRMGVDGRRAVDSVIPRLLAWCSRQGLLAVSPNGDEYAMPWRALREYLAARALASFPDFPTRAYTLAGEPQWRDTLLLAVHDLQQGVGAHSAREFLRLLLESHGNAHRRITDVLLAAEGLLEFENRSGPERHMVANTQESLQALIRTEEATAAERVRAGMVLGLLGDPRFEQLIPPMVRVPSGFFLLGTRDGYEDEGPQQWIDVAAFAIGTYPVTNREYARFLHETPQHPRPKYWHDQIYNNPSQPVVGITWHDAVAYCFWLTTKLHGNGLLPASMRFRLPSEIEWEKAASWDAKQRVKYDYPWGDTWLAGAANTTEGRGTWVTAPVGSFPQGLSPYGAHDMIGNVWEWTASEYASYPDALAPFHESGTYTLRGSSCASLPTHARCTYRSRLPADYWRYHLGFRLALGRLDRQ